MQPYGGSEIQLEYLQKHVSKELLDKVNLTISIPEKNPLVFNKPNVLWIQNSYDQPNVAPWFMNKLNHRKYDWYVFNSHWVYEKFRYHFKIPTENCLIIKNGFDEDLILKTEYKPNNKIKLVYTSTPWRGLDVLLAAMEKVESDRIELDVYSSTQIYGDQFKDLVDKEYVTLYEKAKSLKNVNYKGYTHHKDLIKVLHTYDVFVYPNHWEETSCIAAIEALACGQVGLITNNGALYETCAEFPIYVPYLTDKKLLIDQFAFAIESLPQIINNVSNEQIKFQMEYYKKFYHWSVIKTYWERFLSGI